MKLIVEKTRDEVKQRDGRRLWSLHIYVETDRQFRRVERRRGTKRIKPRVLARECDFSKLPGEWHMVFALAAREEKT